MTENYHRGMSLIKSGDLEQAAEVLLGEPEDSVYRGMALGNAGLALRRLDQFQDAQAASLAAIEYCNANGCPHPPSWVQFIRDYAEAHAGQQLYATSIQIFNAAVHTANRLSVEFPDQAEEVELQKAYTFNSWGSTLLHLRRTTGALDLFRGAQEIYAKYPDRDTGKAETLTNLANAYREVHNPTSAELALREALDVAVRTQNLDQIHRIRTSLIQLESSVIDTADWDRVLTEAAEHAEGERRFSTAYIRRCIHAEVALHRGDPATAMKVLADAIRIENLLDSGDLNPAKARALMGDAMEKLCLDADQIVPILIDGADKWYRRLRVEEQSPDFWNLVVTMHDHFRVLSRHLLAQGLAAAALAAFEAGRALAHAVEVDPRYFERVVANNPFSNGEVSLHLLQAAQSTLETDELILVPTVLPPVIVVFVVCRASVSNVDLRMSENLEDRVHLFGDLRLIATRLQEGVGLRAIPAEILHLAQQVASVVGTRTIRAIVPYSDLHLVPWRVLLRNCGLAWHQLNCSVEFGLFLRTAEAPAWSVGSCVALANGSAGHGSISVDFVDEARDFANAFVPLGTLVTAVDAERLRRALAQDAVVMVSCHGSISVDDDGELYLDLADGRRPVSEIVPLRIQARLVILSACESGVYELAWSDFPSGAAPQLLRLGARYVVGARFKLSADFARYFFPKFAALLNAGQIPSQALAGASETAERDGHDLWRALACVEVLGGP